MQDHRNLQAFDLADELALEVYRITMMMPDEERFGLINQMRRAAVSVASNIVEGCARSTNKELLHFLHISYGSVRELDYQLSLSMRLKFISQEAHDQVSTIAVRTAKAIYGLIQKVKEQA
ncbi:four helix bundle protein [bacterium]|nr:four helix bundle protein [bacterium]